MSSTNLLLDHSDRELDYNEPSYQESDSLTSSMRLYRDWRTRWAQQLFHEAGEHYDRRRPETNAHIIEYPYHPLFPKAFAKGICGSGKGNTRLILADVEYFLEQLSDHFDYPLRKIGMPKMQKPDCDYLIDIIKDIHYSSKSTKNIERALQWLTAKKEQLLPWPQYKVKSNPASNDKPANKNEIIMQEHDIQNNNEDYLFLRNDFKWEKVDELAEESGIISKGKYKLGPRKQASITGLIDSLRKYNIINKLTLEKLQGIFGRRYSIGVNSRRSLDVRSKYEKIVDDILEKRGLKKPTRID